MPDTQRNDELGVDSVPEEFHYLMAWAKDTKDVLVETSGPDDPGDIPPRVAFLRENKLVAHGFAQHVDRDEGLDLTRIGVPIFEADEIDMLLDAHMADKSFFERYGRLPDPHELQDLCDNEGACDIGLTTDCIMAFHVQRDGRMVAVYLPYHVDRRMEVLPAKVAKSIKGEEREHIKREGNTYTKVTRTCHWQDAKIMFTDSDRDGHHYEGIVPDALTDAFARPSLRSLMEQEGYGADAFDLTPEQARLHADIAGVRMLASLGFPVALATYSEEESEVVQRSMSRSRTISVIDGATGEEVVKVPVEVEEDPAVDALLAMQDAFFAIRGREMEANRKARHDQELAEREARRAARTDPLTPSADDVARFVGDQAGVTRPPA